VSAGFNYANLRLSPSGDYLVTIYAGNGSPCSAQVIAGYPLVLTPEDINGKCISIGPVGSPTSLIRVYPAAIPFPILFGISTVRADESLSTFDDGINKCLGRNAPSSRRVDALFSAVGECAQTIKNGVFWHLKLTLSAGKYFVERYGTTDDACLGLAIEGPFPFSAMEQGDCFEYETRGAAPYFYAAETQELEYPVRFRLIDQEALQNNGVYCSGDSCFDWCQRLAGTEASNYKGLGLSVGISAGGVCKTMDYDSKLYHWALIPSQYGNGSYAMTAFNDQTCTAPGTTQDSEYLFTKSDINGCLVINEKDVYMIKEQKLAFPLQMRWQQQCGIYTNPETGERSPNCVCEKLDLDKARIVNFYEAERCTTAINFGEFETYMMHFSTQGVWEIYRFADDRCQELKEVIAAFDRDEIYPLAPVYSDTIFMTRASKCVITSDGKGILNMGPPAKRRSNPNATLVVAFGIAVDFAPPLTNFQSADIRQAYANKLNLDVDGVQILQRMNLTLNGENATVLLMTARDINNKISTGTVQEDLKLLNNGLFPVATECCGPTAMSVFAIDDEVWVVRSMAELFNGFAEEVKQTVPLGVYKTAPTWSNVQNDALIKELAGIFGVPLDHVICPVSQQKFTVDGNSNTFVLCEAMPPAFMTTKVFKAAIDGNTELFYIDTFEPVFPGTILECIQANLALSALIQLEI
jgi:hypothetical protein